MEKPRPDTQNKGASSEEVDAVGPPLDGIGTPRAVDQQAKTINISNSGVTEEASLETLQFDYEGDADNYFKNAVVEEDNVEAAAAPPGDGGPSDDPFIGRCLVNRYRMIRRVGTGGFGAVYEAEDTKIHKRVAVKVLARDLVGDASMVSRFHKEAEAASKVGHENIIDITDFDKTNDGHYFLVMEFLDGVDLGSIIRNGEKISLARVLGIMIQVCRGLNMAHEKGIVHRDLKPGNIFLTTRGSLADFVKLLDFGITKFTEVDEDGSRLTRTGQIIGTPMYMSPEQALGEEMIDHRADIYSLGVIMYELVTGQPPFTAVNYLGIIAQHASDPPTPPSRVRPDLQIPAEVEQIILKCLAKRPDERYPSLVEMEAALVHSLAHVDPAIAVGYNPGGVPPSILTTHTRLSQRRLSSGRSMPLWLIFAIAALVGLGGAVVASFTRQAGSQRKAGVADSGQAALISPDSGHGVTVTTGPDSGAQDRGASAAETQARSLPRDLVKVSVETTPPGASVYDAQGKALGVTPLVMTLDRSKESVAFTFKKSGFHRARHTVAPIKDRTIKVPLKRRYSGGIPDDPKGWGER